MEEFLNTLIQLPFAGVTIYILYKIYLDNKELLNGRLKNIEDKLDEIIRCLDRLKQNIYK